MRKNQDTRGKSYFDIFDTKEGQIDISYNFPETIRAFHCHHKKDETWFCVDGEFKVVLTDPAEIVFLSEGESVFIKRGRWHGFQVLGNENATMLEFTTRKHLEDTSDDLRKPFNEFDSWKIEKK